MVNVKEGIGCATESNENDYMQYDCFFCCNYIATVTVDKTVTIITRISTMTVITALPTWRLLSSL